MILGGREAAGAHARERILASANELTCRYGWAWITMGKVADATGFSRQKVYAEIGTKTKLGEELIARELGFFLERATAGLQAHPDDLGAAMRQGVLNVMEFAQQSSLLQAIVGQSFGGASELLPLLTTQSSMLLGLAGEVLFGELQRFDLKTDQVTTRQVIDFLVRTMLSHVTYSNSSPDLLADTVALIVTRTLAQG